MKNLLLLLILMIFTSCQEVGENKPMLGDTDEKQPIIIANKNRHMNIAEFWIDKIEKPDAVIMSEKEIERFNNNTVHKKKTLNYFKETPKTYSSSWIKKNFKKLQRHQKSCSIFC